jgi:hypothetical protein
MVRRRATAFLVAAASALAGLLTARCESPPLLSVVPPLDMCCWCMATHNSPRGTRCSRGSISDCVSDFEHFNLEELSYRCLRDVCGTECSFLASQLPERQTIMDCCTCLSQEENEGAPCFHGTAEECADEIDENEPGTLFQGAGLCVETVCQRPCAALFGGGESVDAGQGLPDASLPSREDASVVTVPDAAMWRRDAGGRTSPRLPWDGGCPLAWGCY